MRRVLAGLTMMIILTSALTSLLILPSANQNSLATVIGSNFPVGSGSGEQSIASAAYNLQNDQYMVVYENITAQDNGLHTNGVILNADGSIAFGPFPLTSFSSNQQRPVVVYNSADGVFFVVWNDFRDKLGRGFNLYGHAYWPNGTAVMGSDIQISNGPADELEHWLVYNSRDNQYMSGWRDTRNSGTTDIDIYGQIINANGTLHNGEIAISVRPKAQLFQHIAHNSAIDQYLVVWTDTRNTTTGSDIYGRRLNADGAAIGQEIRISSAPSSQSRPVNDYNSRNNEYFVTWPDNRNPTTTPDIYGARVSAGGQIATDLPIAVNDATQMRPEIAYNPINNQHLIAWSDGRNNTTNGFDIYAQIIGAHGKRLGSEIIVSDVGGDQIKPIVVFNSLQNQYLVVWTDHRNNDYDIYGQTVDANP
jgi:hypothetical protein